MWQGQQHMLWYGLDLLHNLWAKEMLHIEEIVSSYERRIHDSEVFCFT